jgi:hypothetical protein
MPWSPSKKWSEPTSVDALGFGKEALPEGHENVTERDPASIRTPAPPSPGSIGPAAVPLPGFDISQQTGPRRDVGIASADKNTGRRGETQ